MCRDEDVCIGTKGCELYVYRHRALLCAGVCKGLSADLEADRN